ncbi:acyltransferase family protein [Flavobacterium terrigena]|uniref:Fucose 4-O-acetylase n=1 Tax=Flavobacterium terrigena TaxID=402734 RepID=A0A1H6R8S1_9FLAO|nr:acyltransferase [Flavobacterium terrigena]SEI48907.1 Fucose 4-O-acetylase [Flavobacterium terrigena]
MIKKDKIETNAVLNVARSFAIISVIMAHSRSLSYDYLSVFTERIGAVGVVTFLIISGYYYNVEKYGRTLFFKNKIKTIIVPWVFTGTLLYLIGLKFNFLDWLLWIIGYKTYLYYLSVLLSCYFIFSFFKLLQFLYFSVIITLVSLLLTSFGLIDSFWKICFPNFIFYNYFNIFNWIGFFAIGILLKNKMEILIETVSSKWLILLFFYICFVIVSVYIEPKNGGYFSSLAFFTDLFGFVLILALSTRKIFHNAIVYKVSELSFAIYLTQFLVFPFRKFFFNHPIMEFINPLVLLSLITFFLIIGAIIATYLKLNNVYELLLGIRSKKNKS